MESLQVAHAANPVVLSGDLHAFGVAELRADPRDPTTPLVAPEFVATSISSNGLAQELLESWVKESPELAMLDSRERGYVRLDITPGRLDIAHVAAKDVRDPGSAVSVTRRYVVEAGSPRVHRA
jgi:alkaline phosphatase D